MNKSLAFAVGMLVAGGLVLAQDHNNSTERPAKDDVVFRTDVRVGTTMLTAGEYRVMCDTKTITFTRLVSAKDQEEKDLLDPLTRVQVLGNTKALEVPCRGKELKEKAAQSSWSIATDKDGVKYLDTLCLKGSTIEHTFR